MFKVVRSLQKPTSPMSSAFNIFSRISASLPRHMSQQISRLTSNWIASSSDSAIASQSVGLLESVFRGKDYSFFHNRGKEVIIGCTYFLEPFWCNRQQSERR